MPLLQLLYMAVLLYMLLPLPPSALPTPARGQKASAAVITLLYNAPPASPRKPDPSKLMLLLLLAMLLTP
jgi:hypothetical protein